MNVRTTRKLFNKLIKALLILDLKALSHLEDSFAAFLSHMELLFLLGAGWFIITSLIIILVKTIVLEIF